VLPYLPTESHIWADQRLRKPSHRLYKPFASPGLCVLVTSIGDVRHCVLAESGTKSAAIGNLWGAGTNPSFGVSGSAACLQAAMLPRVFLSLYPRLSS